LAADVSAGVIESGGLPGRQAVSLQRGRELTQGDIVEDVRASPLSRLPEAQGLTEILLGALHPQQTAIIDQVSWESGEMIRKYATWRILKGGDPREVKADIEQEKLALMDFCHAMMLVKEMTLQDTLRWRVRHPSAEGRKKAKELWSRLKPRDMKTRRLFIEVTPELRHWSLSELIGRESLKMTRRAPEAALELAELAVDLARRIQIDQAFRRRLRGFALACRGNVRLALGDRHEMGLGPKE
jgi:hypothetical protein